MWFLATGSSQLSQTPKPPYNGFFTGFAPFCNLAQTILRTAKNNSPEPNNFSIPSLSYAYITYVLTATGQDPTVMANLNETHIAYIRKDLRSRGIVVDDFQDEVVDHFAAAIEAEMDLGKNFVEAHRIVLKRFGHTSGLRATQHHILQTFHQTSGSMFSNHVRIAWRNLNKQQFFTAINIFGLGMGVAACIIIALYMQHELSYDRHFVNANRIYRMNSDISFNGNHFSSATMPADAARALRAEFPEVESSMHFHPWPWRWVRRGVDSFKEQNIAFASQEIFKVFGWPLISGDTATALREPNTVVVSQGVADKYFPGERAVGQTIVIDNTHYAITGVFNDLPDNTHFKLDFILSMEGNDASKDNSWLTDNFNTYILLRNGASVKDLEAKFSTLVDKYLGPQAKASFGTNIALNSERSADKVVYSLTRITDIHLHSHRDREMSANSDITYVYLFGAVAFFILVVACINFMNLSTARSANRAKEVGVRKMMGSVRAHLVRQFLTESVLMSAFSFLLALGIVYLLLPPFNTLAQRSLQIPFSNPWFIVVMLGSTISVGVLAGMYPAFFLSSFKPVHVLKGKVVGGIKRSGMRSTLVVVQFMISIFLVTGTIAVHKQMAFIQEKNLGYDKDQVVVVHNTETLGSSLQPFKRALEGSSLIQQASVSGYVPISGWARSARAFWKLGQQASSEDHVVMECWSVDHDYVPTMGMKLKEGRNFSQSFPADSTAVVINAAAAKQLGLDDPIGEKLETFAFLPNAFDPNQHVALTVIGVVEDFHFESLKDNIAPLSMRLGESNWSMVVRFKSESAADVVRLLERTWKQYSPDRPFEYNFLDEAFGNMYASERRLEKVFGIFAVLAIAIACLGLFALTAYTAEQRTKEIGVRKVLGASVTSIVYLLSLEFGKLIAVAFILSAPLAWLAIDWWLDGYQYKVQVGLAVYAISGLLAFTVAWLTMSYQSIKAAMNNPIHALRNE